MYVYGCTLRSRDASILALLSSFQSDWVNAFRNSVINQLRISLDTTKPILNC